MEETIAESINGLPNAGALDEINSNTYNTHALEDPSRRELYDRRFACQAVKQQPSQSPYSVVGQ